ncbi:13553_t:CDS:2 [Dentiscutata erythropus]|uniref:13553_t:CDS:1 n=1 Tax=Dentiscutata erythropus TaxID=1348616 RepID=A0A9N8ZQ93_9GLOM|nr:13553_t:CDS:2 [Dentiscutata erythropus]
MNEISELIILLNSNLLCVDDRNNGEHNIDSHAQSLRNLEWYYKAIDEGRIVKFGYSEFFNIREIGQGGYGIVYSADYGEQKVALKRFTQNNSIINFANEIKQIYTVNNHENINRFHGITKEQRPNLNEILGCLEEISKEVDNKFITYSDRQRRASTPSLTTDNSSSLSSSSDHSEYFSIQLTISINTTNIITRSQAEKISDWIYENNIIRCEFRLRYMGGRDSDGAEFKNFHKHCDNISGTVVVLRVRATGEILGGYNPIKWKTAPRKFGVMPTSDYGVTDKAFIFSFKDEKTIFSKVKNPDKAIYYKDEYAVSFGKSDLSLINDMTLNYKWYCKQKNYSKPIRSSVGSFEVDDYQVFEDLNSVLHLLRSLRKVLVINSNKNKKTTLPRKFQFTTNMNPSIYDTTYLSSPEIITSSLFLAVSLALTADSFLRAIVDKTINSNYRLLFPINISILINEILMVFLIRASQICSDDSNALINLDPNCTYTAKVSFPKCSDKSSIYLYYTILPITRIFYLIIKPSMIYLAYKRAASISRKFASPLSRLIAYIFIAARIIEVVMTTTFFFVDGFKCRGSYCDPLCWITCFKIYYVRDIVAPFFRVYYIIAESVFYLRLFQKVRELKNDKRIRRVIFHQSFLFTIDIIQLLAMMIYREVGRFEHQLPTYIYAELFSTAFTIFVMTKFVDRIPNLLEAKSNNANGNIELDEKEENLQLQNNETFS